MDKRSFLQKMGQAALITPFLPLSLSATSPEERGTYELDDEDDFWQRIRIDYALKPDYINLENGYYNIAPIPTIEKFHKHIEQVNYEGSHYMRTVQWDNKKRIASRLAQLVGCDSDELIITRNTTESLDMIIGGYPWEKGDEAVFAVQDYGAMREHFKLTAKRYGLVLKTISLPNHPASDEEIVSLYESQIGPKTKLMMICHMVNITGQILPVRKICDMAHSHGVEVMVDGAHCVGHIEVDIKELNCDYYGSSLHKWLSTPLGAGILFVAKKNISKIWPLLAEHHREPDDIGRLNHIGTHPVHTDLTINDALDYLELIGMERKEKRLRYLQRYWSDKLRDTENIIINTPLEPHRSCGIANVGIRHMKPSELAKTLMEEFRIFTVAIDHHNVQGCRITPNVYTTTAELDDFVKAMKILAERT
ncbi:MAG: aminotransferase class V-fold PLP-dependent enzyme [Flavobacteriaceae bacterium]|nr:aminotransferase class V-fold PLP-dependent enzyme [Muriicola sp.]MBT8291192.1 aminotransferase class V-fold PLP-dependent enzyme [Muriicola sp.]NNK36391.1 aminotransferase class V-fold PLP-dependent enzyme [Eudoraea sp.]NNL38513.1 aminotransferase class V-fold PLP-dependent enzyme [Flavobacteriaceae bacterium]